jgi:hypothetical protein
VHECWSSLDVEQYHIRDAGEVFAKDSRRDEFHHLYEKRYVFNPDNEEHESPPEQQQGPSEKSIVR